MPMVTKEFKQYVQDDIAGRGGLSQPIPAGLLERLMPHTVKIEELHPNPDDEFSEPGIGPNYEIVSQYERFIHEQMEHTGAPPTQALTVAKLSTGGYMIVNGHHRWLAARRAGVKKMLVKVVNIITEDDVLAKMNASERSLCASFDLDEVLLTDGKNVPAHRRPFFPLSLIFKKSLRRNAPELIKKLQAMGFDVWVYTGDFHSERYLQALFSLCGVKVDGILNGMGGHRNRPRMREAFREKYRVSLHIDNQSVRWVNTRSKTFDQADLPEGADWANAAYDIVKDVDFTEGGQA